MFLYNNLQDKREKTKNAIGIFNSTLVVIKFLLEVVLYSTLHLIRPYLNNK